MGAMTLALARTSVPGELGPGVESPAGEKP